MTRTRASARAADSRAERAVADWLARELDDDRIDRRVRTGARDRGDIGGLRPHGQRITVEVKDAVRHDLAGWVDETEAERGNDDGLAGVLIVKRRGTTDVGDWYAVLTGRDLIALLTGERPA